MSWRDELQPRVEHLHHLIDANGSGDLDAEEWNRCCGFLASISEDFAGEDSFDYIDRDGSGRVSAEEFWEELESLVEVLGQRQFAAALEGAIKQIEAAQKEAKQPKKPRPLDAALEVGVGRLREVFRCIDRDGSGVLDREELRFFLERCFLDTDYDPSNLLQELDEDETGEIDYEEFLQGLSPKKALVEHLGAMIEHLGHAVGRAAVFLVAAAPWLFFPGYVPGSWPHGTLGQESQLQGSLGEGAVDIRISHDGEAVVFSGIVGEADVEVRLKRAAGAKGAGQSCQLSGRLGQDGTFNATIAEASSSTLEAMGSVGPHKLSLMCERQADGFRLAGQFDGAVALYGRRAGEGELTCAGACGPEWTFVKVKVGPSDLHITGNLGRSMLEMRLLLA